MELLKQYLHKIESPSQTAFKDAEHHLNQLTKPPGSLGKLENIAARLSAIRDELFPDFSKKAVIVMAGDHGVCEEGVSHYPQSVTGQMILNFLAGGAAVNVLARQAKADVFCVDIGSATHTEHPELISKKVCFGTKNIVYRSAMSEVEAIQSIEIGIEIVHHLYNHGYRCFATGEMGIGNTTVSTALISVLLNVSSEKLVGYGTGIDEQRKKHKAEVIAKAIKRYRAESGYKTEQTARFGIELLAQLGGSEIGGLVGVIIGCAALKCPVVIDGVISTAAALIAATIAPKSMEFMFASHLSVEPAHRFALDYLQLEPMLHMDMRLGEGTGAVLCFPIIDAAAAIMREMATFDRAGVSKSVSEINEP